MDRRRFLQLLAGAWIAPQLPDTGADEADLRLLLMRDELGDVAPTYEPTYGMDIRAVATVVHYPKLIYEIGTERGIIVPSFLSKGDKRTRMLDMSHVVANLLSNTPGAMKRVYVSESAGGWINAVDMGRKDERARMNPLKDILAPINQAFASIECHDLSVANIVVHPKRAKLFTDLDKNTFMRADSEQRKRGIVGHLWSGTVLQSSRCNSNEILLTAEPEYVGPMPVWYENEREMKAGMAVHNDYTVAKLVFIG